MENKQSPIYWTIIKRVKDELEISINEYLLMESIYMLSFNEFNYCYASKETLAKNLDLSKQTVLRLVENLIKKGLLEKNINDSSKLRPSKYYNDIAHVTYDNTMLPTVTKNYQDGNKMLPNDGNKMLPNNKSINNKNYNNNTAKFNNFDLTIFQNDLLRKKVAEFIEYRKEIKKPYLSQKSIESLKTQLLKLSNNNINLAIDIINQTIANGWQGLFEIKTNIVPKQNNYSTSSLETLK